MNTTPHIRTAERLGCWLGRGWRGYVRGERKVLARMVAKGVPMGFAVALLWVVKLAVLGVLLYVAFWVALIVIGVMTVGWATNLNAPEEHEWPFTDLTKLRKTSGYDPNMYNDSSHEMFIDD